jgi:large subunit ribosomal protein L19
MVGNTEEIDILELSEDFMKAQGFTRETIMAGIERGLPAFRPGDTVRVAEHIKEGEKERIQYFEGDIIALHNKGISSTITVRRIGANGVAVERIFPTHSKKFDFEFIREGEVRRAKLYYMRDRIGKEARVQEKARTQEQRTKLEHRLGITEDVTTIPHNEKMQQPEQ